MKLNPVHVKITNFQSIGDVEFDISGFTCVTGPTNIGKSAIIRAISGALLGSPVTGDVRKGKKFCTVELRSDGWELRWEKGERGVNRYWIPVDSDKALDKVGKGQIEQVASMGFGSVQVGDDVLQPWLATQFEPVFLMNKSGPAVTDFLSEVSRLNVLQDGITINVRQKKRCLDQAKVREEEADLLREEEARYSDLDHLLGVRDDLDAQVQSLQEYVDRVELMERLHSSIGSEAKAIMLLRDPIREVKVPQDRLAGHMDSLVEMERTWASMQAEAMQIAVLKPVQDVSVPEDVIAEDVDRLVDAARILAAIESERAAVERLSAEVLLPEDPGIPDGLLRASELLAEITDLRQEEASLQEKLSSINEEVLAVQTELDAIKVCPTCRRPMPAAHPS